MIKFADYNYFGGFVVLSLFELIRSGGQFGHPLTLAEAGCCAVFLLWPKLTKVAISLNMASPYDERYEFGGEKTFRRRVQGLLAAPGNLIYGEFVLSLYLKGPKYYTNFDKGLLKIYD